MEEVVLGIDLGTSAIKIIAVNRQGEVLETVSEPLKLFQEQPGYSEQDPNEWFQATKRGVKRIISSNALKNKAVKGLSFSGQMHGLVVLNKKDSPYAMQYSGMILEIRNSVVKLKKCMVRDSTITQY